MSVFAPLHGVAAAARPAVEGRVTGVVGLAATVAGVAARVGDLVLIDVGGRELPAEVVSLAADKVVCLPLGGLDGVGVGQGVVNTGRPLRVTVGPDLRGRVLDGLGRPIDGGPPLAGEFVTVEMAPPPALDRGLITEPLQLGVRALDTAVPCGRGQRVGIFAGSGVGKSSLLSMITRGTSAEVSVIALIGERGREVREFLEHDLGREGLARSVVVVATSDQPALVRLRAAFTATRIAEWHRDQGADVLLMMDSLTRVATAQREVGLSAGEPPATRGYPPSVFALMPRLLERAGPGATGSITGLYTVLVEGDDHNEPIADAARSILDGHIVLTRALATAAHFPSVDVLESVSRVAGAVTTPAQRADLRELRGLLAAHRDVRELVEIGAYVAGTNPAADRAMALWPRLTTFLQQDLEVQVPARQSWAELHELLHGTETP